MLAITENSDEVKLLNLRDASRNEMYSKEDIEKHLGRSAMQQEHGENPGKRNTVRNYRKKSKLHRYNRNLHQEKRAKLSLRSKRRMT